MRRPKLTNPNDIRGIRENANKLTELTYYEKNDETSTRKLWIAGVLLMAVSLTISFISPNTWYIRKKMVLTDGGELFDLWMTPNVELLAKIYIFNITNKKEFFGGDEKLRLREVGPYVYRLRCNYRNPIFNDNEGTVSVIPELFFEWDPKLNNRSEEEFLTLTNLILLSAVGKEYDQFGIVKATMNQIFRQLDSQAIEEQQTPKSFLFGTNNSLHTLLSRLIPSYFKYDRAGVLVSTVDTKDTTITYFSGKTNFTRAGLIANVDNKTHLSHFESPCNRLAGASDGKKFGNHVDPKRTLYMYSRTLCRAIPVIPTGEPTITNQRILVSPYTLSDEAFDNGQINPENKCFCKKGRCLPYGLLDASSCFMDYPIAISYPHFYKGDPSLLYNLDGLHPNETLHRTKLFLNLETGTITSLKLRIQSNFYFGDLSNIESCRKFSNMTVPLTWMDIGFPELKPTIALRIYVALYVFPVVEKVFIVVTFLMGACFIFKVIRSIKVKYQRGTALSCKIMTTIITKDDAKK